MSNKTHGRLQINRADAVDLSVMRDVRIEKMTFPIYECPESLPERIPEILQGQGMAVRVAVIQERDGFPEPKPSDFGYHVDRGLVGASVFGGQDDGTTYFHITWRRGWSVLLPWISSRLTRDIQTALFQHGAKHMDLDKLKESEQ